MVKTGYYIVHVSEFIYIYIYVQKHEFVLKTQVSKQCFKIIPSIFSCNFTKPYRNTRNNWILVSQTGEEIN